MSNEPDSPMDEGGGGDRARRLERYFADRARAQAQRIADSMAARRGAANPARTTEEYEVLDQ